MVTFAVGKGNETHLQPQHLTTMEERLGFRGQGVQGLGFGLRVQDFCGADLGVLAWCFMSGQDETANNVGS